ncbi:TonB family protein [Roseateles sp.]|uniref:TonB family protein n=1 Tax=Roseateles sp. TaxID=1971397 RepID=UPI00286BE756|nr:TonB family protein [Roseateles sp.]
MRGRDCCVRSGLLALLLASIGWAGSARAQAATVTATKPEASTELSAEQRAQKQADKVFTFIKLQSLKPAAKRAAPEPAVASVQVKVAPKPQAKPAQAPTTTTTTNANADADADADADAEPPLPAAQPPATLLAAASLGAASVQPELLPQPQAAPPAAEPPALQLLSKVEPEIPRQLQADFKGGSVTLRFMVQTDGSVTQAQALQSTHRRLALAAITAVNQWRFAPLPAPREATVDIAFALE